MTFRRRAFFAAPLLILASCDARSAPQQTVDFRNSAAAQAPAIALTGRVTDAAGILNPAEEASLTTKLEALERRTKHQMVIVTVSSLGGRDVADFTRDLANSWGVGREKEDDGVVLLVAPNERMVRIAVGYGLEKTLIHEVCAKIIDEKMVPRLRQRDYSGAIEAATDALLSRLG